MLYKYSYDLSGRTLGISGSDSTSVNYVYDDFSRVSKQMAKVQSNTLSTEYLYGNAENGQLNGVIYGIKQNGQNSLSYSYDNLTRLNIRTIDGADSYKTEYSYLDGGSANTTTTMVKTVKNGDDILEYSYDDVGNITEVKKNGTVTESYSYDSLNQLVGATYGGHTYTYTYDNGGNILSVKKDGTAVKSYAYGDTEWKDLLTQYNGETITYDQIGNPLSYRNGFNFTWSNGRQLTGITNGNENISYLYNADGQRVQKTVNGSVTDYYYINGILQAQKTGDEYILFLYDENGTAYGMVIKNGTTEEYYYYLFNAQGDVIGIVNQDGVQVVSYEYGAWGDITSITGSLAQTIGEKNPIRYRGYYYDTGTGFYYLQSRYYDAETQRILNGDGLDTLTATLEDVTDKNLFAYCDNNPIMRLDNDGEFWKEVALVGVTVAIVGLTIATAGATLPALATSFALSTSLASTAVVAGTSMAITGFSITTTSYVGAFVTNTVKNRISLNKAGDGISEHTKNKSKSKWNKHTKKRSGGKERADSRRKQRINPKKRNTRRRR